MKHAFLVALVRSLQSKPKGLLLLDTHAGPGEYDLESAAAGLSLPRQPEHPEGIGKILGAASGFTARRGETSLGSACAIDWAAPSAPAATPDERARGALVEYVALVKAFSSDGRRYPGSPRLLQMMARAQDRVVLCELHPEEAETLAIVMGRTPQISVQPADGYVRLRAFLPPPERRGLILIDPPYEAADEWVKVRTALADALARFATGTYVIWHPLTARAGAERFWDEIAEGEGPPAWVGRLLVRPRAEGFRGSGLIVVNPPYAFVTYADALLRELAKLLCPNGADGAASRLIRSDRL